MQRVFVDFGRGMGDQVPLLLTSSANEGIAVQEGEAIIVTDEELEVQGIAHQGVNSLGIPFWYATVDWTTQQDIEFAPSSLDDVTTSAQP